MSFFLFFARSSSFTVYSWASSVDCCEALLVVSFFSFSHGNKGLLRFRESCSDAVGWLVDGGLFSSFRPL